jgi:hypothetical protein
MEQSMDTHIFNAEKHFADFMTLKERFVAFQADTQQQASIVQNSMTISDADFEIWWLNQLKLTESLKQFTVDWQALHVRIAEDRRFGGIDDRV